MPLFPSKGRPDRDCGGRPAFPLYARPSRAALYPLLSGYRLPLVRPRDQRTRPAALYVWRLKRSHLRTEFHQRVAERVVAAFQAGWLADIGCGPGLLARKLLARTPELRLVCVDIDSKMLEAARSSGCRYLVRASADQLPFRSGVINLVVSTASLKDWANPAKGLAEILRVIPVESAGFVFDFITVGPGSNPPHFARRYGIAAELLRRVMGVFVSFSIDDARKLAQGLSALGAQVEIETETDLGVLGMIIRKRKN